MKKKVFKVALATVILGTGFFIWKSQRSEPLSDLMLANIEALAADESGKETKCPDYNYVPDHYLRVDSEVIMVVCSRRGEISIGNTTFHGSYNRNEEYPVIIQTKNCSEVQKGACCDQREIGVSYVEG